MKFGKLLQDEQNNGQCLLNYKELKRIINYVENEGEWESCKETDRLALSSSGFQGDVLGEHDPPRIREIRMAFFYRLGRELDSVNQHYLQKISELESRFYLLIEKRQLMARRPGWETNTTLNLKGALSDIQAELDRLQRCAELNAEGFRKILKKWDKRTKSATKEVYLTRQIKVTPMFQGDRLAKLCDKVEETRSCLEDKDQRAEQKSAIETKEANTELIRELQETTILRDEKSLSLFLTKHKTEPSILSRVLMDALHEASIPCLLVLIKNGADVNFVEDLTGRSCFHEAAIKGQVDLVDFCIKCGADPALSDFSGRTLLHYMAIYGHSECLKLVLSKFDGLLLNPIDKMGCVPFFYAISTGHEDVAKLLLLAPSFNLRDYEPKSGLLPLSLAAKQGLTGLAELLLKSGCQIEPNNDSDSLYPLHHAAKEGCNDTVRLLLEYKHPLDPKDPSNGWTPLFFAAAGGHLECVRTLCEAGCDRSIADVNGWLAWTHALYRGHIAIARALYPGFDDPVLAESKASFREQPDILSTSPLPETRAEASLGGISLKPLQPKSCLAKTPSPSFALSVGDQARAGEYGKVGGSGKKEQSEDLPSLELPPPIVPFRIYGHHYLEKRHYISIRFESIGDNFSLNLHRNRSLKYVRLVMHTTSGLDDGLPQSLVLPLSGNSLPLTVFPTEKQLQEDFQITFDVYPTFGSYIIGRAILVPRVLQSLFKDGRIEQSCVLPLINKALKCVGELQFFVTSFTPFKHPRLDVSGPIETYWKSTKVVRDGRGQCARPSVVITASSLLKHYVTIPVQITRDNIVVVYDRLSVKTNNISIPVPLLTFKQGRSFVGGSDPFTLPSLLESLEEFAKQLACSWMPLERVLVELPESVGIHIQVWRDASTAHSGASDDEYCNAILKTVYDCENSRSIIFSSFSTSFCTMLNWKQPNYPVFFGTFAGYTPFNLFNVHTDLGAELGYVQSSVRRALKFSRDLKLFGILCYAEPLIKAPLLAKAVKEAGLSLAVFTKPSLNICGIDELYVDATLVGSIFSYSNEILR